MAEPSLGQAIGLQGQTNNTQRMAQSLGQVLGQQAARKAKQDLLKAKDDAEQEEEIGKWFRQKGKFHKLVLPEVDKVLNETMNEVIKIKNSDDPYSSNRLARLRLDLDSKMREIAFNSDYLFKFNDAVKKLDQNKNFYGPVQPVDEFKDFYLNRAKSIDDLKAWAATNEDKFNNYFSIGEDGLPTLTAKSAIPYQRDLQIKVKNLNPTIFSEEIVSLPDAFGQKEMKRVMVRPLYDVDAKTAYKNNKAAYPDGPPISIEAIVKNYLELNPEVYEQASAKMNVPLRTLEDGTYNPEDLKSLEDKLILSLAEFTNPELKGKLMKPAAQFNINMPGAQKATPQKFSFALETINQGLDPQTSKPVEHISLGLSDIQVDGITIPSSEQFRNRYRKPLTGSIGNAKIERLRQMAYVTITGSAGDKIKVPATKEEIASGKAEGIFPFVEFSYSGGNVYTPINYYSKPDTFAGSKYDANMWKEVIDDYVLKAATFNKSLSGRKIKNLAELNNFVNTAAK